MIVEKKSTLANFFDCFGFISVPIEMGEIRSFRTESQNHRWCAVCVLRTRGAEVRYCNEHGTIYAISSDFGDRMTTQLMGLMVLLSEHF